MIRKLRRRLMAATVVLLTLVLLLSMYLFFSSTYRGMETDSLDALHLAGLRYGLHGTHPEDGGPEGVPPDKPDWDSNEKGHQKEEPGRKSSIPCFVVGYDHDSQLYAKGPHYYDLTDTEDMAKLVREAAATDQSYGILWGRQLRFLRLDDVCGEAFAFTDISSEQSALARLLYRYVLIGLLAMIGFFLIALLTSRWAVRPIERVMDQQRQFVADASHELKTPLTVILTNAELLSSGEYSSAEQGKFTGSILTTAQQMRGLVEELLDLARADSGMPVFQQQKLDLSQMISDAALPFEAMYFEAGRTLQLQIAPNIEGWGNPQELMRVVDILLDNGCKYSKPGSTVTLELHRCGLTACQISVRSQGDTLNKQECQDIFKRFFRRDVSRSMNHSYGLGLPIARSIIRQHKGRLWLHSREGVNTFYIRLSTVHTGKRK